MKTEREKSIDKILKCLRLSKSANEHEAAAAMRQAQALMEKHSVSDQEVAAAEASQRQAKAGAKVKPANWETVLAGKVAKAFGCRLIFVSGRMAGQWSFIGAGAGPEVASYGFAVLYRQAKAARHAYVHEQLSRCKPASRLRRGDTFCEGWVQVAVGSLSALTVEPAQAAAIEAYVALQWPALNTLAPRDRNEGKSMREHDWRDLAAGRLSGKAAKLARGVGGAEERRALGSGA